MKNRAELFTELSKFFRQDAAELITKYEQERKDDMLPVFMQRIFGSTCIISILGGFIIPPLFILFFLSVIIFAIYSSCSKNKKIKTTVDKNGSKVISYDIETDYEMTIKRELMPKFLQIFDCNLVWYKYTDIQQQQAINNQDKIAQAKNIGQIKAIFDSMQDEKVKLERFEIFENSLITTFDDIISGQILNVPLDIIETKFGLSTSSMIKIYPILPYILFFMPFLLFFLLIGFIKYFSFVFNLLVKLSPSGIPMTVFIGAMLFVPLSIIAVIVTIILIIRKKHKKLRNVIIRFKIPKKIKAHTVIFEKNHKFKQKNKSEKFERIKLENIVFENKYDTYSTNQVEARYLLTTLFMKRFEDIKTSFTAKNIRAEFKGDELVILIETNKDLFQMGAITKKTTMETFSIMLSEIYSTLAIANQLNLDSQTGL